MKRFLILLMLCLASVIGYSQQYMYVNRDTLPMYKYPDHQSKVVLLLHAPCKIAAEELADSSAEGREIAKDWTAVKFFVSDGTWSGGTTYYGYVPKNYLVNDLSQVTVPGADTSLLLAVTIPANDSSMMRPTSIGFRQTLSGQCYYLNSHAKREYVQDMYCNKEEMEKRRKEEEENR